ncbi:MAG: HAD-IIIA family hydrolase [Verrucomicrobiota bacterium]
MSVAAAFFDRDGVINRSPGNGYVLKPEDFHLNDGLVDALRFFQDREFLSVVVTSQRCVGKGLITRLELDALHEKMQSELAKAGVAFDAIYAFTGEPGTEDWEKPKPGMIKAAVGEHGIDLTRSLLIGDADRDIEMARNSNIPTTIRVRTDKPLGIDADHTIDDLRELTPLLKLIF